jgi:hypothetical protein
VKTSRRCARLNLAEVSHAHPAGRSSPSGRQQKTRTTDFVMPRCDETTAAGAWGTCRKRTSVVTATPERPNARKSAARKLQARTGMPYSAALRQVELAAKPWQPRHRWVLTDELRGWLAGESWRGIGYHDLYSWLDHEVSPVFECDRCFEPGDARTGDSSIALLVTAYDPDLSPFTQHLSTKKYHAACRESGIIWATPAIIPAPPQRVALPASAEPSLVGEFEIDAHALLDVDPVDGSQHAMLLLPVRVVEDHGQGAAAWLTELELYLASDNAALVHDLDLDDAVPEDEEETGWALRIATGNATEDRPTWIALRTGHGDNDDGTPDHLLLCQLEFPDGWAEAAHRVGRVDVAVGPCTRHWPSLPLPPDLPDEIADLIHDAAGPAPRCACAHLTADHVVELIESGAFRAGSARVLTAEEIR